MKLLTRELEERFLELGSQEGRGDQAIVPTKFFTPAGSWSWFLIAYDPQARKFFGLVDGLEVELGYFSLLELERVRGPLGLPIERDLYWHERMLAEVRAALTRRIHL